MIMYVDDDDVDVNTGCSRRGGRCGMLGGHIDIHEHGGAGTSCNHGGRVNNNRMTVAAGERRRITSGGDYSHPCDDHDGYADNDGVHIHVHRHNNQDRSQVRRN